MLRLCSWCCVAQVRRLVVGVVGGGGVGGSSSGGVRVGCARCVTDVVPIDAGWNARGAAAKGRQRDARGWSLSVAAQARAQTDKKVARRSLSHAKCGSRDAQRAALSRGPRGVGNGRGDKPAAALMSVGDGPLSRPHPSSCRCARRGRTSRTGARSRAPWRRTQSCRRRSVLMVGF